jgi:hypothetical protein
MGTFHQGKSELHGITVVVDTPGAEIYVGRCDDEDERGIVLNDADVHIDGQGGRSKDQYVKRAAEVGVFARHPRIFVPRPQIASIRRLGEL